MKTLLPNPAVLSLEKIVTQADAITMIVTANRPQVHCPGCRQLSPRVHSRYQRGITDLPWGEITVKLELQTRKFFCDNDECHQRIFCERLPEVVAPYGRQTIRFNRSLTAVGFALALRNASVAMGAFTRSNTATALILSGSDALGEVITLTTSEITLLRSPMDDSGASRAATTEG